MPTPLGSAVERLEDMSVRGRLRVLQELDGDMVLSIVPDPEKDPGACMLTVEFCTSGGKSPRTREALQALMRAMEEDNADPLCDGRKGRV